jgi:WXG100 family type VII secretion target
MPNVNVTYDEMRSAATRLTAGREEINAKLSELQKLVNSLVNGGYVTDTSSKQFEHSYHEFTSGASRTMEGLTGMSTYLTAAADTFQQADQQLASHLNKGH